MIAILAAFQFLTILPPLVRRQFSTREMGWSVAFYPLVGAALGGVLLGAFWAFSQVLPPAITAALVLALWVILTRALHLDGFMDCCDGLFGGFTPERRLAIMRDSRVGAFGVAGGVLLLLARYAALTVLAPEPALLAVPVLGRWVMSMALVAYPYARDEGLGRVMKDHARWPQALLASLIALAAAYLAAGVAGLIALGLAAALLVLAAAWVMRRIPGLTGDVYGALCELVELAVLLFLVVRLA